MTKDMGIKIFHIFQWQWQYDQYWATPIYLYIWLIIFSAVVIIITRFTERVSGLIKQEQPRVAVVTRRRL